MGDEPLYGVLHAALEVMDAKKGVAIAANQLGHTGRWWVMRLGGRPCCVWDAKVSLEGPFTMVEEGCLSLPGQFSKVRRSENVWVEGSGCFFKEGVKWERFVGRWTGLNAQIAQHESDHLDGNIFLDCVTSQAERSRIKGNMLKLRKQGKLKP